ncbi:MAG: ATPase, T2SS/T4P/T4SS family [Ethanoligenens sp.]
MISYSFFLPDQTELTYPDAYNLVRSYLSEEHSKEFNSKHSDVPKLAGIIRRYFVSRGIHANEDLNDVAEKMAQDMGGLSFLSKYLEHLDEYPTLEEININAWNSIVLRYSDRPDEWLSESFIDPESALATINKIKSDTDTDTLSPAFPGSIGYVFESVREASMCAPIVPNSVGIYGSIRIVRPAPLSTQSILGSGCMTQKMLDLIVMFMKHSVNILIGGKPRAGKTTILNYLLSILASDPNIRIGIIEEGSREVVLTTFDENGRPKNQVLSMLTRPSEVHKQNYDSNRLLQICLRFGLDVIVVQEMRSGEAYVAVKTANTGMAVYSTIHSNDGESTYYRGVDLMEEGSPQPEPVLMRKLVLGFPVVLYFKRMEDGVRRCMEIMEGFYEHGELRCQTLFRFVTDDNGRAENGKVHVKGHFEQINNLSDRTRRILLNNGVMLEDLKTFTKDGDVA